jgi:hypothetical protein
VTLESSMELQLCSLAQLHVVPWNHGSYAQGLEITHSISSARRARCLCMSFW